MTALLSVLLNLLFGAGCVCAWEGLARGVQFVYTKAQDPWLENWQLWLFVVVGLVVLTIRKFQPVTWVVDRVKERWHFHIVIFLTWVSLTSTFHWSIPLGLDLKGGSELLYRVRYENLPPNQRTGVTQQTVDILEKRLNPQGTRELRIQQQGNHRILIQLPGANVAQTQRDKERIQKAGRLEFRLVDTEPGHIDAAKQGRRVAGVTPFVLTNPAMERYDKTSFSKLKEMDLSKAKWMLVDNKAPFTGKDLARAHPGFGEMGPVVRFEFKGRAKRRFARFTDENKGRQLAIVLDDVLYSAPVIRSRIYGPGEISGSFTQEEVNNLVITLRAGSLPADVEMEMENHVGPTLGEDSIHKSVLAILIAMAIVLSFMALYYLAAGCVADFALMLNLLLVMGAMSLLGATLTLPGIAGLILTVGMSVDANVLIYERIREEKGTGKALRLAIANGYGRAFTTIIDANLTTLITAMILYLVGTGPVKGFAVTLSLGIITSMFTALFVTRSVFEYWREKGWLTEFKMNRLIGETNLSFSALRKVMFVVSIAAIIGGLTAFAQRGSRKYDIDFTGGTRLLLELTKPMSIDEARKRVAEAGYPRAEVQSLWVGSESDASGTNQFNIRIPAQSLDRGRIEQIISTDLRSALAKKSEVVGIAFPTSPLAPDVTLKTPVTESAVRVALATKDYPESLTEEILSPDAKGCRFLIHLEGNLSEAERKATRRAISNALTDLLRHQEVSYVLGRLREIPDDGEAERAGSHQIEINLDTPVGAEVLEKQMKDLGFTDVRAAGRGGQSGSDVVKRAVLIGSEATLKGVREKGDGKFSVVAFEFPGEGQIKMELKEPMTEAQLREKIAAVQDSIQSIIPTDAKGKEYRIVLEELDDTKLGKCVADDLTNAFSDYVALQKVGVTFEPAEPPADMTEEEKEQAEKCQFVTMKLAQPQAMSTVRDRLMKADCLRCLVQPPAAQDEKQDDAREVGEVLLQLPKDEVETREARMATAFEVPDPFRLVVRIGATVAGEMKNRAFLALVFALGAIIIYIWFRFGELKFGIAAVIALAHDVSIAMGALAVADMIGSTPVGRALLIGDIKISLPVVAAFLTIIGYSLNDTIVVFDRIRENLERRPSKAVDSEVVDRSVNQTLSRTLLTSLTTLVVVVSLYLMGGSVIHGFAYALIIGVVVGTYSSIFIASPILIEWDRFRKSRRQS